ncbi:desmoglein-4-like [Pelodytes ibericus]
MDWMLCAKFGAFFIFMVTLQCSCDWNVQVNHGKDEKGKIIWEPLQQKRQKRHWITPPMFLREEEDNSYRNPIAKIRSDIEVKVNIRYTLSGPGVDQYPFGVFVINPRTGEMNVTRAIIDREKIPMFFLVCRALSPTGADIEKPLDLRVRVIDINDNPPVFTQTAFSGSIAERSRANTLVMKMTATDADEEGTVNALIAYRIISQSPFDPPMFFMNKDSGEVFTMTNLIDREKQSSYSLVVGGSDLDGAAGGMSGQCSANIQILDVNDNFPTLEFESYSVQIIENMMGVTELRMKAFDADEMYTDNWLAEFNIVSGNEGGWFAIETDAQTNEGILRVVKALDYESMQMANLGFVVTNKAAFHSSVASQFQSQVTKLIVQVQDQREGPTFFPSTIPANIPAGLSGAALWSYVLARCQVIDRDTGKPATNIRYVLSQEAQKFLYIDSTTGEIKLINNLARDSPNVNNGTYTAQVFAITDDLPSMTATATVAVAVPRSNDNCPVITTEPRQACLNTMRVVIQGYDNDSSPYGPPLTFQMIPESPDWTIERINDTSIALVGNTGSAPRNVSVDLLVTDNANLSCPQPWTFRVQVCECTDGGICDASKLSGKSVSLGPAAIGLMVLGFLLLLLALLLLPLCLCGSAARAASTFVPVAEGYDGACRPWGDEGAKPEDVDMNTMLINSSAPDYTDLYTNNIAGVGAGLGTAAAVAGGLGALSAGGNNTSIYGERNFIGDGAGYDGNMETVVRSGESNMEGSLGTGLPSQYREGGNLNMAYVENYFAEKADAYANEDENRPSNDCLLIYDNEGIGSPAGSIGCCSFIADDLDDDYLDSLGPKFKTLAEICIGQEIDPVLSGEEPRVFANVSVVENDSNIHLDNSTLVHGNPSLPVGVSSYSSTNLQPARPGPDFFVPGNVVVTETYTTSGAGMKPATYTVEPRHQPSILVTERVVGPGSGGQGGFSDIPDGSNIIVTERVLRPVSGVHEIRDLPNFSDGSNVVLRESVIGPSNSRFSNSFNIQDISDSQNVVVTERLMQPVSGSQGSFSIQPVNSAQNVIVTEKTLRSGQGMTNAMLSTEPLLSQTIGSTSPSVTRSKVTKYSTVQYTKK